MTFHKGGHAPPYADPPPTTEEARAIQTQRRERERIEGGAIIAETVAVAAALDDAQAIHHRRALLDAAEHAVALGEALDIPAVDLSDVLRQGAAKPFATGHVCTAEETVAIGFEPWTGECPVPPNSAWPRFGAKHLPFAHIAWCLNTKSKEDLMRLLAKIDDGDKSLVQKLWDDVQHTGKFFKVLSDMMETAELRLLVALSTMTVDPRYRDRFIEERAP